MKEGFTCISTPPFMFTSLIKTVQKKKPLEVPSALILRYELGPRLGSGGYGFVLSAVDRLTGQTCAIKFIYKRKIPLSSSPIEIALLQHTRHANIISMLTWFQDDLFYYLVMETQHGLWETGPDLFACLEEHDHFSETMARHIFTQVVDAVLYLKQLGYYHRDIKDENILIDRDFNIKLIDFGSAIRLGPTKISHFHGTLSFAAPEILKGLAYEPEPAEVWSLGVLLYTLLYGKVPFSTPFQAIHCHYHATGIRTSKSGNLLLSALFRKNPKQRLTLEQLKQHPWITGDISDTSR